MLTTCVCVRATGRLDVSWTGTCWLILNLETSERFLWISFHFFFFFSQTRRRWSGAADRVCFLSDDIPQVDTRCHREGDPYPLILCSTCFASLPLCLSASLPLYLSTSLPLPICLSTSLPLPICLSTSLPLYLSTSLPLYLCLSTSLPLYLSTSLPTSGNYTHVQ